MLIRDNRPTAAVLLREYLATKPVGAMLGHAQLIGHVARRQGKFARDTATSSAVRRHLLKLEAKRVLVRIEQAAGSRQVVYRLNRAVVMPVVAREEALA